MIMSRVSLGAQAVDPTTVERAVEALAVATELESGVSYDGGIIDYRM